LSCSTSWASRSRNGSSLLMDLERDRLTSSFLMLSRDRELKPQRPRRDRRDMERERRERDRDRRDLERDLDRESSRINN
jgi:hypothetical protein